MLNTVGAEPLTGAAGRVGGEGGMVREQTVVGAAATQEAYMDSQGLEHREDEAEILPQEMSPKK